MDIDEYLKSGDGNYTGIILEQLGVGEAADRDRRILELRYGLVDGKAHTLEEVGRKVGVTRERVRQLQSRAIRKLSHPTRTRAIIEAMTIGRRSRLD